MIFKTQSEFLEKISNWNFITNPSAKIVKGLEQIEKQQEKLIKNAHH